VSIESPCTTSY